MMTKKDFIALADAIRDYSSYNYLPLVAFTDVQLDCLAMWCRRQNPAFKRERWLGYIRGECGPNGGTVKGGK